MMETKTNNLTTIISIKNWQIYQVSRNRKVKKNISIGEQNGDQKETKTESRRRPKRRQTIMIIMLIILLLRKKKNRNQENL